MSTTWTAAELHDELALFYRKYRGRLAPDNIYTQSLWDAILLAELYEEGEAA